MTDTTNQKGLQTKQRKVRSWPKKDPKSSSSVSETQTWPSKKSNRPVAKASERGTRVVRRVTSSAQDIGLARRGEVSMRVEDVLSRLEKHEAECNLRYSRIEEKLSEQNKTLAGMDIRIWGIAILILITPLVHKVWG